MYANLAVRTPNGKTLHAYRVDIGPDGTDVYLDSNTEGSYYEEAGMLHFHPNAKLSIAADF